MGWKRPKHEMIGSDPVGHHRRSIRLRGYDYSQAGAYFITLCTRNRQCILGDVDKGEMTLNKYGLIVEKEWLRTRVVRVNVDLDMYVVMPNHFHGIIVLTNEVGATRRVAPTGLQPDSIGAIIGQFKSIVTKQINHIRNTAGVPLWQRNYYEHIIRSEKTLNNIRRYIQTNPLLWEYDRENPNRLPVTPREINRLVAKNYGFTEEGKGWP